MFQHASTTPLRADGVQLLLAPVRDLDLLRATPPRRRGGPARTVLLKRMRTGDSRPIERAVVDLRQHAVLRGACRASRPG